jgi:hypothetical protein
MGQGHPGHEQLLGQGGEGGGEKVVMVMAGVGEELVGGGEGEGGEAGRRAGHGEVRGEEGVEPGQPQGEAKVPEGRQA